MQKVFDQMKAIMAADVLCAYPDHNKPFRIFTEAYDYQLGAGPSMVQLVRGLLLESLDRGSNPLLGRLLLESLVRGWCPTCLAMVHSGLESW